MIGSVSELGARKVFIGGSIINYISAYFGIFATFTLAFAAYLID